MAKASKKLKSAKSLLPLIVLGIILLGISGLLVLVQGSTDLRAKAYPRNAPIPPITGPICTTTGRTTCVNSILYEQCTPGSQQTWQPAGFVTLPFSATALVDCGQGCTTDCLPYGVTTDGTYTKICYCPGTVTFSDECTITNGIPQEKCEANKYFYCRKGYDARVFATRNYWYANGYKCGSVCFNTPITTGHKFSICKP